MVMIIKILIVIALIFAIFCCSLVIWIGLYCKDELWEAIYEALKERRDKK